MFKQGPIEADSEVEGDNRLPKDKRTTYLRSLKSYPEAGGTARTFQDMD